MKVFKFGGASVKNADAVRNVAAILNKYPHKKIMVIVSAMGKTTNALEQLTNSFVKYTDVQKHISDIHKFHYNIMDELFEDKNHGVFKETDELFRQIRKYVERKPGRNFDYEYDQIVSFGEFISTKIVSHYLNQVGIMNQWYDVRELIKTDATYREAKVDWEATVNLINKNVMPFFKSDKKKQKIALTQGFIGSTKDNHTTTLSREGSDYTAAIFAYAMDAEDVTIWKDVPGLLNADPKYFSETKKLNKISYRETIELAYYGATIIHPKTIKPLQNKRIPLNVKSFLTPDEQGSLIARATEFDTLIPSFIFKVNQVLISISPKDFSFIAEDNLCNLFGCFARMGIKINTMQNSAISFSVCVDDDKTKVPLLIDELKEDYNIKYNKNLELITIRHYDQYTIDRVLQNKKVLLEQKSRTTVQLVVKPIQ